MSFTQLLGLCAVLLAVVLLARPASAQRAARRAARGQAPYQVETFPLSASPCAVKGYPVTIHFGAFVRSDGRTFPVPSGHFLLGAWGQSGISWAVGDANQPAPDSLEILYFSYTEDTFYEGQFALPQQRIYELLKTGFWKTPEQRHATYDELTVCALPKGVVVVWLTGAGGQVLIGRFQGRVSDAAFQQFYPKSDRAAMYRQEMAERPADVQQRMRAGTISTQQWDDYLATYSWQVSLPDFLTLTNYRVDYFSSEYTAYPATPDLAPYVQLLLTPQPRRVPSRFSLYVRDAAGHQHRLRAGPFDATETLTAFAALSPPAAPHPLTLRVEADPTLHTVTLALTNGLRTLPLLKTAVTVSAVP